MQPQNSRFFRISKRSLSTLLLTLSAENYYNIHTRTEKAGSDRQTGLQRARELAAPRVY